MQVLPWNFYLKLHLHNNSPRLNHFNSRDSHLNPFLACLAEVIVAYPILSTLDYLLYHFFHLFYPLFVQDAFKDAVLYWGAKVLEGIMEFSPPPIILNVIRYYNIHMRTFTTYFDIATFVSNLKFAYLALKE